MKMKVRRVVAILPVFAVNDLTPRRWQRRPRKETVVAPVRRRYAAYLLTTVAIAALAVAEVGAQDSTGPSVSGLHFRQVPAKDATYALGERVGVTVEFDEPVTVTGTPQLTLTIGTATRAVDLDHSFDDGLAFYYVVQATDMDADGISIAANALSLNGGTIRDAGGNDADLNLGAHAISNDGDHKVDGSIDRAPVVDGVYFISDTFEDTHGVGETVEIHLSFNEPVTVTGTPQLTLDFGDTETRTVDLNHTCCDSRVFIFIYEVQQGDMDSDGISVAADALSLNGGTIRDAGGNDAELDLGEYAISNDGDHKVDGSIDRAPVVEWAGIDSRPASGDTYAVGERISVDVSFSEPVRVTGTPQLALTIGAAIRAIGIDDIWDNREGFTFRYVVQATDMDADGISMAANALSLNGGTIRDAGGNDAELDLGEYAISNDGDHKVDGSIDNPPVVKWAGIDSRPASGDTYGVGETIRFDVNYNEAVTVTGTPQLRMTIGTVTKTVDLDHAGDEGPRFRYVVQATDMDADGISMAANALSLNGGTIRDAGGNDAELDLGEYAISNDGDHKVDGSIDRVPVVQRVGIDSSPLIGDTYAVGERISVDVSFSEPVRVTGAPQLALTIGAAIRAIGIDDIWDNREGFTFRYVVQATDMDADGISIAANALSLNGGTIRDAGGNDAELDLGEFAISNDGDHKVDGSIDRAPVVDGVYFISDTFEDTHGVGETVEIHLSFNEPVTVTGTPQLTLDFGDTETRTVDLNHTCCDSRVFIFIYEVQQGDMDSDGISVAADALSLNGGTIRDAGGNDAELDLGEYAISNDGDHKVNGSIDNPPVVQEGYWSSAPQQSGNTYGHAERIRYTVEFSEPITVTGRPEMTLIIGNTARSMEMEDTWEDGIRFSYQVRTNDLDADGISVVNRLRFAAGIRDSSGKPAVPNLGDVPTNDFRHRVDGSIDPPPIVIGADIWTRPVRDDTYFLGERIGLWVRFNEPVTAVGTPRLELTIGSSTRIAPGSVDSEVPSRLWFEYAVRNDDHDADGITVAANALMPPAGGVIRDAGGNDAVLSLGEHAITNDALHKVDSSADHPALVTRVRLFSRPASEDTYARGETIMFEINLSEPVTASGSPRLTLNIGNRTRTARAAEFDGDRISAADGFQFHYVVQEDDLDTDGITVATDALSLPAGASIRDAGGNDADLDLGEHAVSNDGDHKVDGSREDTTAPSVRTAVVSAPQSGDTFARGETISVNVYFSEAVTVSGSPQLALTLGHAVRSAEFDGMVWADTIRFRYQVQANDQDQDGIGVTANALRLRHGDAITDFAGNAAELSLGEHASRISNASNRKVDGGRPGAAGPVVAGVHVATTPQSGDTYVRGETITVQVDFSEAVTVSGSPRLTLDIGAAARAAAFDRTAFDGIGHSGDSLRFQYVVQEQDSDDDGISVAVAALSLNGGAVTDADGNAAALDLGRHALGAAAGHKVDGSRQDTIGPVVTDVRMATTPQSRDTYYSRGETIRIQIDFNEAVTVSGSPRLALGIGAATHMAILHEAQGSSAWWNYLVQTGDRDDDGISIAPDALSLNGGAIADAAGNNAALTLGAHGFSNREAHKVDGDRLTPVGTITVPLLMVGVDVATVDLANHFDEPDGQTLIYTAVSSAPAVASVSVAGSTLTITPVATGRAAVTARATNPDNRTAVQTFDVKVAQEHAVVKAEPGEETGSVQYTPKANGEHKVGEVTVKVTGDKEVPDGLAITLPESETATEKWIEIDVDPDATPGPLPSERRLVSGSAAVDISMDPLPLRPVRVCLPLGTESAREPVVYRFDKAEDAWTPLPTEVVLREDGVRVACVDTREFSLFVMTVRTETPSGGGAAPSNVATLSGLGLSAGMLEPTFSAETFAYAAIVDDDIESIAVTPTATDAAAAIRVGIHGEDGVVVESGNSSDAIPVKEGVTIITIRVTAGDGEATSTYTVTIQRDHQGIVVLSTMSPYVGVTLTATLHDPDGVEGARWQWWRRESSEGEWTRIPNATGTAYTPVLGDVGHALQARVDYRDRYGDQHARSEPTEPVDLNPERRARMMQLALTGFGRSVATTAVDVIGQRFAAAAPATDLDVTLGGRELRFAGARDVAGTARLARDVTEALGIRVISESEVSYRPVAGQTLLTESAFSAAQTDEAGRRFAVWGTGDYSSFAGKLDGFEQNGTVVSGYGGVDYRLSPQVLIGLAASHGRLDLQSTSEQEGEATLTGNLTSVYPYGQWQPLEWLGIWGVAGYGRGGSELVDVGGTFGGDLSMMLGAVGQRVDVLSIGPVAMAVKADGFLTRVDFRGGGLPAVRTDVWRTRLLLESGLEWDLGADSRLAPRVEVGGRLDGGTAERGYGAELGGSVSYTHAGIGLSVAGRGRLLLVHQADGLRDWGASVALRWNPPGPGEGLALSVAPTWGEPASGVDALWQDRQVVLAGDGGTEGSSDRSSVLPDTVDAKLSYGLEMADGAGVLTPFAEVVFTGRQARRVRAGTRLEIAGAVAASGFKLEAFGESTARNGNYSDYLFGLNGSVEY